MSVSSPHTLQLILKAIQLKHKSDHSTSLHSNGPLTQSKGSCLCFTQRLHKSVLNSSPATSP